MTYEELHGGTLPSWGQDDTVEKPFAKHTMCIGKHNENHKISHISAHHDLNEWLLDDGNGLNNHEISYLRVDDYLANSYMAYWVSFKREIDFSGLLSPLGDFGEFIGGMLPKVQIILQEYIKINLSGLPDFIIRFSIGLTFNCKPLADIGNTIKKLDFTTGKDIYNAVWPKEVTEFCDREDDHELYAKLSIGFKGELSIYTIPSFMKYCDSHFGCLF